MHAAVALHPNEAPRIVHGDPDGWSRQGAREPGGDAALDEALAEIDRLAALPQVKGVGETGLDYFRTGPEGKAAQERSFRAHIEIAKRHGKALVIHDRDAHADVLRDPEGGGRARADRLPLLLRRRRDGRSVRRRTATSCPSPATSPSRTPSRCATRSPSPRWNWSSSRPTRPSSRPAPYRGRPNAPYLIPVTVRAMAAVRGIDEDALATALAANTARAFDY